MAGWIDSQSLRPRLGRERRPGDFRQRAVALQLKYCDSVSRSLLAGRSINVVTAGMNRDRRNRPIHREGCAGHGREISVGTIDEVREHIPRLPIADIEAISTLIGGHRLRK